MRGPALLVANKVDVLQQASSTGSTGSVTGSTDGSEIGLPLLARETFAKVVMTSARDGSGIQELDQVRML